VVTARGQGVLTWSCVLGSPCQGSRQGEEEEEVLLPPTSRVWYWGSWFG
jgi:hypothetical protein